MVASMAINTQTLWKATKSSNTMQLQFQGLAGKKPWDFSIL